jgi:hypothetical protein
MHPSCAHSLERAITAFSIDARVSLSGILLPMLRIIIFWRASAYEALFNGHIARLGPK